MLEKVDRFTTVGPPIYDGAEAMRRAYGQAAMSGAEYGLMGSPAQSALAVNPAAVALTTAVTSNVVTNRNYARSLEPNRTITGTYSTHVPVPPPMASYIPTQMPPAVVVAEAEGLKQENMALRADLHRLRKVEAGWTPSSQRDLTNVTVVNSYQLQVNQLLEEVNTLRGTASQLEQENMRLAERVRFLESQPQVTQISSHYQQQITRLNAELMALRSKSTAPNPMIERAHEEQITALRRDR